MSFPFVIRQVNLPARVILLRGRALPYQGVAWGGTMRADPNWFPGNPVASLQIIGPTYKPTTITGKWKDIFLFNEDSAALLVNFPVLSGPSLPGATERGGETFKSGGSVPSQLAQRARVLRDAIELMRREGGLLKVEWGSIVRYGIISDTNFPHDREEDIEYEIEFKWIGDTASQPKRLLPKLDLLSALQIILQALDKVINALLGVILKAFLFITKIQQFITKLGSFVTSLLEALKRITSFVFAPADILNNIRANLRAIILEARDLFDDLRADPSAAYQAALQGSVKDIVEANLFLSSFRSQVQQLAADAAEKQREIEEFAGPELLGLYTATGGESLRDVAQQYYGEWRNWRTLAEFNGIDRSILVRGTIVRIPRLQ